ncbi:hypothetical protein BEWA_000940 [Theileria equi strain WA]|uniref:ER membrane protein complex subunit 2 n=1 Tax=Theileria equi strain WA TaxID=1537102 RepID=L0B0M1_THEEQ|nr:hypothetical protein BEWA_000940 [Theileria equi strain WA]AFZ80689.1 hypothetical protein BEWA_000940 [Theileria equi strain WA]|eukprot:XP_004830355.1 hypothetical protein BEWA_000940 [Theileria equi strain WA]
MNEYIIEGISILSTQTHDLKTRKSILNFFKHQGTVLQYVDMLNKHLGEYVTDFETWHELGEVYLQQHRYEYAIYCFEECLFNKLKRLYNIITIAEIHSSINDIFMSAKYFSLALSFDQDNVRALWGLAYVYKDHFKDVYREHVRLDAREGSEIFMTTFEGPEFDPDYVIYKLYPSVIKKLLKIYSGIDNVSSRVSVRVLEGFLESAKV